jgi:predicted transcriptional regulator
VNKCGDIAIVHESIEGKISNILRVDNEGTIIECSSPIYSHYTGLNVKNKEYFKKPKETNEPYIDSSIRHGTTRQIIVTTPIFETTKYTPYPNFLGEFKGILLSIIELSSLYDLYIHPIVDPQKSFFLLIKMENEETILKSKNIEEYLKIKNDLPADLNTLTEINGFEKTIVTSSDIILGLDRWKLIVLTPLKNVGKDINAVQTRHFFTLGFVIIVIITGFAFLIRLYKSKEDVQLRLKKANVTLEKLGISIETEKDKYTQADIILEPKKIYLIKEDDENHAHELFISSLNNGFAGLGIVRDNPKEFRKKYNLQKTSFIWLSNTKSKDTPGETKINTLYNLIREFVENSKKSTILIDRLDYILTENNFEDVIKKIHDLKDLVSTNNCIIILSVNQYIIPTSQLKTIEAETIDLYGKHLKNKVDLSDMEMEILKFINEHNIENKLASYKSITNKFNITKPTTRTKINTLQKLGLLQVEQRGRFKSLKITSAGRRIID